MARLTLQRMVCDNFKSFKHVEFEFSDEHVNRVCGRNGSGKTSIADALTWVLFNKSSRGDAPGSDNFREKPLDEQGNEMHSLTTSVELFCTLNEAPVIFRREQKEKWERVKGAAQQTYKGNVSVYYINGAEVKLADFKSKIASICSEDVFRYVASLSAFNEADWKKRRGIILGLHNEECDMIKPEYAELHGEAAAHSMSIPEYRVYLSSECKRLSNEQRSIPARIDEVRNNMPHIDEQTIKDARYTRDETQKDIESVNTRIAKLKAENPEDEVRRKAELEEKLRAVKSRIEAEHTAKRNQLTIDCGVKHTATVNAQRMMESASAAQMRNAASLEKAKQERLSLVSAYKSTYAEQIKDIDSVCPTCGQAIPQDRIDTARAEAEKQRNAKLKDIESKGLAAKSIIATLGSEKTELDANFESAKTAYDTFLADENKAKLELSTMPAKPNFDCIDEVAEIEREILVIGNHQRTTTDEKIASLIEQRNDLAKRQQAAANVLYDVDNWNKAKARIESLEQSFADIGATIGDMEQKMLLAQQYEIDKCASVEKDINAKFGNIRWKLFDSAINGNITECCTCMVKCGETFVPYESANSASRINADIEIVRVLSEHFNTWMVLFVDNAETVLSMADAGTQTIALYVEDCDLTVR